VSEGVKIESKNFFEKFYCFFVLRMTQFAKKWKKIFSKFFEIFENSILGTFGPKKGQRDFFLKNLIRPLFTPYIPLTSCKKSEKTNDSILRKIPKTSFLGHFWPFLAIFGQMHFFLKNRAPSVFIIYGPLTSCKKSEKTNEPILRKVRCWQTDRQTDWLTDGSNFIGPNFKKVRVQ